MTRLTATLLRCVSLSLLGLFAAASTNTHGTSVVKILVTEGDDVTLPCSMTTKEDLRGGLFEWNKDGRQEVFLYDGGSHSGNGREGQDPQYKGRVSHFEDQLQYGNASILIRNTQINDSAIYICVISRPLPGREFYIELVVELSFKDRLGLITGAAPPPYIKILDLTDGRVLLQCEVRGAHPQPELQWQAADGSVVPAQEPQVSERGGRYDVTLLATVTKSAGNSFRCEVKQKELHHVIHDDVTVSEKLFASSAAPPPSPCITVPEKPVVSSTGFIIGVWFFGVVIGAVVVAALIGLVLYIRKRRKNGSRQQQKRSEEEEVRLSTVPEMVNGSAVNHGETLNGSGQLVNGSAEDRV